MAAEESAERRSSAWRAARKSAGVTRILEYSGGFYSFVCPSCRPFVASQARSSTHVDAVTRKRHWKRVSLNEFVDTGSFSLRSKLGTKRSSRKRTNAVSTLGEESPNYGVADPCDRRQLILLASMSSPRAH